METTEIAVWSGAAGVVLIGTLLFSFFAIMQLAILASSGIGASWAANTTEYVDKWVGVAKMGGIAISLFGLEMFLADAMDESVSTASLESGGVFIAGALIYAAVPEVVRVLRRRKELKNVTT